MSKFLPAIEKLLALEEGDILRTPFAPSGLVEVVKIEPENWPITVQVCFLHDHAGYAKGSLGRYLLIEFEEQIAKEQVPYE